MVTIDSNNYLEYMIAQKQYECELLSENSKLEIKLMLAERDLKRIGRDSGKLSVNRISNCNLGERENRQCGYIQKDEVAKRLKKSTRWVEMQCKAGVIPYIKINRSVLFDWDAVVSSLNNCSRGGVVRKY
jgi:hypothetical protein